MAAYKTQENLSITEVAQGFSGQPRKLALASNFAATPLGINMEWATHAKELDYWLVPSSFIEHQFNS